MFCASAHLIHLAAFQDLASFGSFSAQELADENNMDPVLVKKILTDFSFDIDARRTRAAARRARAGAASPR